jgi:enolase
MNTTIRSIPAREIIDSRGNPMVAAELNSRAEYAGRGAFKAGAV